MTSWLVLFDIDGTLVQTLGAGVRAMADAFGALHGRPDALHGIRVAGRTDQSIVIDAFTRIGVEPSDPRVRALSAAYFARLPAELHRAEGAGFGVLPGVRGLLDAMTARRDVGVGLLTGNFEAGAAIKLRHFDLWDRFAFGAFGDRHLDRRDLVPVALERARRAGIDVPISRVVVIGDTPLDVDCARAHGAVAVGVATGTYTRDDLGQAGADVVLGSLEECDPAGAWLAGLG
ncbi:MAG: haloacid dehalogenase-like hydrolase [Acidobacteria bacterium]|nr:haloacid dehalogenase-like hydrolase [Acidobacteriota bacterium]